MNKNKKKDPIKNRDTVVAYSNNKNVKFEINFGKLKRLFVGKKLGEIIVDRIYLPRTKTFWKVIYRETKGFVYEKLVALKDVNPKGVVKL